MRELDTTELNAVTGASLLLMLPCAVYHIDYKAVAEAAAAESK